MTTDIHIFTFKVVLIGDGAVGKSSLMRRFVENRFESTYQFTIGVDISAKDVKYEEGKYAKLSIWDMGGQERFKVLRRSFFEGTHGALLVFDLSRAQTFAAMKKWLSDLRSMVEERIPIIIIGNKSDLISEVGETIKKNEPSSLAEKENSIYIETSAKTGENVEKAFLELTQLMREQNS
jgi:small GTP-binding protein